MAVGIESINAYVGRAAARGTRTTGRARAAELVASLLDLSFAEPTGATP
jgi:hypothetical protein